MNKKQLKKLGLLHTNPAVMTQCQYTDIPTGELDVPRLLDGKADFWRLAVNTAEKDFKKKIIISDWSVRYQTDNYNEIISLWHAFLKQGFKIAVWTGALTSIASFEDLLRALYLVQPIHRDQLEKQLAALDMSRDEYIIADVGTTKKLFNELNYLDIDDLFLDTSRLIELPPKEIEALLKSIASEPSVTLKVSDIKKNWGLFKEYIKKNRAISINNVTMVPDYKIDEFHNFSTKRMQLVDVSAVRKTYLICAHHEAYSACFGVDWRFVSSELKLLISLDVWLYTEDHLYSLGYLASCKTLKTLKIKAAPCLFEQDFHDKNHLLDNIKVPVTVQSLHFENFPLDWILLQRFLRSLPNIEMVTVKNCRLNDFFPNDFTLPESIRVFDATETSICFSQLQQLVHDHPKIEVINFRYQYKNDVYHFTLPDELQILRITFAGQRIEWKKIFQLFSAYSKLKLLSLNNGLFGVLPSNIGLPERMTVFDASRTNITWLQLQQLVQDHTSIQEIVVAYCDDLGGISPSFNLPDSLWSLDISHTYFKNENIAGLVRLITSSKIQRLNFSGCKDWIHLLLHHPFLKNNQINEINLYSTDASNDLIQHFVDQCPKLIKLNISCDDETLKKWQNRYPALKIMSNMDLPLYDSNARFQQVPSTNYSSSHTRMPDANTQSSARLGGQQIFKYKKNEHPYPSKYRLKIYNHVNNKFEFKTNENKGINKIANVMNLTDVEGEYESKYRHLDNYFLARIEVDPNQTDWIPLPSLSIKENILPEWIHIFAPVRGQLGYCKEEQLYYLKLDDLINQKVTVSFMLEADLFHKNVMSAKAISLPEKEMLCQLQFHKDGYLIKNNGYYFLMKLMPRDRIQLLVNFFNHFTDKPLLNNPVVNVDIINAIIAHEAGVCRHRSMAFIALAKELGLCDVWMVENSVHAFIEINCDDVRFVADLGGGSAALVQIKPMVDVLPQMSNLSVSSSNDVAESSPIVVPTEVSLDNPFRSWDMFPSNAATMVDYSKELFKHAQALDSSKKNVLVMLSSEQIESLHTAILADKKECYFLHDLDSVREKTFIVKGDGSTSPQDSALIQYVNQAKPGDILLVDWSGYKTSHVGYNTIIDAKRNIKGIPVPEDVIVINVLDRKKAKMIGDDFYSRCRFISDCPSTIPQQSVLPAMPKYNEYDRWTLPPPEIKFYSDDWKSVLLGKMTLSQKGVQLGASALLSLIQQKQITLRNAPWHLSDFRIFITELLTKRCVEINGIYYNISENLEFVRDDTPYALSHYSNYLVYSYESRFHFDLLLNTNTFSTFFQRYCCKNNFLIEIPGFIEAHAKSVVRLLVTETLSVSQWARLLDLASQHNVSCYFIFTENVILPRELMCRMVNGSSDAKPTTSQFKAKFIVSNDMHYSSKDSTNVLSVNVNTTYSDLFEKIQIGDVAGNKVFTHQISVLAQRLLAGEQVTLRGRLSPSLLKQLETLFLPQPYLMINGEIQYLHNGALTFVTDNESQQDLIEMQCVQVSEKDMWAHFIVSASKNEKEVAAKMAKIQSLTRFKQLCQRFCAIANLEPFSYVQLKVMINYFTHYPSSNPLKLFIRQKKNYLELREAAQVAWDEVMGKQAKQAKPVDVMERRLQKVMSKLVCSPYLFIAGSSGIGKSNFVQNKLKQVGYAILEGMDKLRSFMHHPGKIILFIDEANLYADGAFDLLEGLFNQPPGLILDGKFVPLTADHHIIFAGNFGHFKGRQQHEFFDNYGGVITFKEFPDEFLCASILQPIISKVLPALSGESEKHLQSILIKLYHHINEMRDDIHPMTVRNLQMMVMRLPSLLSKMNLVRAACMAAYDEACAVFNKQERQELKAWINQHIINFNIKVEREALKAKVNLSSENMLITKSRRNPLRTLQDIFAIRQLRIDKPSLSNCGANGLIFEGGSGGGKSSLAVEYLRAEGYVNGEQYAVHQAPKRFYCVTPTDLVKMQQVLEKAFHEGAVVIIDEMNTLPLEHILNALLSGVDMSGALAKRAGFFVIATLNPSSQYQNRHALSVALLNRFTKLTLKEYTEKELLEIVTHVCGNEDLARKQVRNYQQAAFFAAFHHKTPSPRPRHLFATVKVK